MNIRVLVGGILFLTVGICHKLSLRLTRLGKYRDSAEAVLHQREIWPFYFSTGIGMILWAFLNPDSQASYAVNMLTVAMLVFTLLKEFRYWTEMGTKH